MKNTTLLGVLTVLVSSFAHAQETPAKRSVFAYPEHFSQDVPLFTFVHLTDTHLIVDKPSVTLRKAIADINLLEPRPRFTVLGGDLINGEHPKESTSLAESLFSQLHCPWFPVFGNHDNRGEFARLLMHCRGVFPRPDRSFSPTTPERFHYSIDVPPYRLIVLDNIETDAKDTWGGKFSTETVAWLRKELGAVGSDTRIILFSHASIYSERPMAKGLPGDAHGFEPILELLKPHRVVAWFAGHAHANFHLKRDGIDYFITGSLSDNRSNRDGQPGYRLVRAYRDRIETTYRTAAQFAAPIVVAQDDTGDFRGSDDRPIRDAVSLAAKTGRSILIRPGNYAIRNQIDLKSGLTIVGSSQTVLRLPPPASIQTAAKMGDDRVIVIDASELATDSNVILCPPTKQRPAIHASVVKARIRRIDGQTIWLTAPLSTDIPAKSGIGCSHNVFFVGGSEQNITLKSLTIDGGLREDVPMPGHTWRSAVLAHGVWDYAGGPSAPPIKSLRILNCRIRNCYGRAVAWYWVVNSRVEGCQIENIADEGIDLDHFCYGIQVRGNDVSRAETGVTINDGSYCTVEGNRLRRCGVGVTIWWWHKCPQRDIDLGNVVRGNFIIEPKGAAISLGNRCFWNEVIGNFVEGSIDVAESRNVVQDNIQIGKQ